MIENKKELVRKFLPDSVVDIDYTHINMDITDLSVSDILRNLNRLYPPNSRYRNAIASGSMVVGVLCRTDTIHPYNGLFILIGMKDLPIDIISCDYIVLCVSEENITTEDKIANTIDDITNYILTNFTGVLTNLPDFYRKFIYNESELYEDDYSSEDY